MYLNTKDFLDLDETKLIKFVELRIKEDLYLDYKVELSSAEKRKTHKEFLKDVTAFANANGGNIFIGFKEPSENLKIEDQIIGIDNAIEWAQDLERLTVSSIDPRISGLKIKTVGFSNSKSVLLIHIPPSLSRPHMVNYDGHKTFYIRHSESSFPMSTHEIRNSVMESISAEEIAKKYLLEKEKDIRRYFLNSTPTFIIQAIPLIALQSSLNIFDEKIEKILRGESRRYNYHYDLTSNIAPEPTIDGLRGLDNRHIPNWQSEIHRNGYVSLVYRNQFPRSFGDDKNFLVHSDFKQLFLSFMKIIEELLLVTGIDVPYIISCKYTSANRTRLFSDRLIERFSDPYEKEEIIFPFHYRQVSEPFIDIAEKLCVELFNAYGYKTII